MADLVSNSRGGDRNVPSSRQRKLGIPLVSSHYSWDVGSCASSSSCSSPSATGGKSSSKANSKGRGKVSIKKDADDSFSEVGGVGQPDAAYVASFVEDILSRVRVTSALPAAPESVRRAVRLLSKRRTLAPIHPALHSKRSASHLLKGMSKRSIDILRARAPAPATMQEASEALSGRGMFSRANIEADGPIAQIQALNHIDATVVSAIGTGAAGGPRQVPSMPLQEPFSVFMPPPYRILFLIALGLLCWSANLRGIRRLGLDAEGLVSGQQSKLRGLPSHHHRRENGHSNSGDEEGIRTTRSSATTETLNGSTLSSTTTLVGEEAYDGDAAATASFGVFLKDPGPQETASFGLGLACMIWVLVCWVAYRLYAFHTIFYGGDAIGGFAHARGRHAQAMQAIAIFGVVVVTLWPGDVMYRSLRRSFAHRLIRICVPSLRQKIHFADVLLADILTSFARVFGDLWLTMIFLWPKSDSHVWWNGKGSIAVPLLVSLPYVVRFRQCLSEYATMAPPPSRSGQAKTMRPLANAAKYASAFPVIWLSVLQSEASTSSLQDDASSSGASSMFFYMWVLSVFANSIFSFWWDVTNDWGLEMLRWETWASTSTRMARGVTSLHKRGLSSLPVGFSLHPTSTPANGNGRLGAEDAHSRRPHHMLGGSSTSSQHHRRDRSAFLRSPTYVMLFPPIVYQLAVVGDLILRFAWSLKLSSHLHHIIELESTAFYLEALEILRRLVWTFLRLEWEACKRRAWNSAGSMESLTLSTLRAGPPSVVSSSSPAATSGAAAATAAGSLSPSPPVPLS